MYKKRAQLPGAYYLMLLLFLSSIDVLAQQNVQEISESKLHNSNAITIVDIMTIRKKVIGKNVQFIDIRTPKEYQEGYIDDAVNISIADKESFLTSVEKLDKEKPIYIYCYSGWRSHRAAKLLETHGFQEIYDFKGGYKEWSEN